MEQTTGRLFLGRHGNTKYNEESAERIRGRARIGLDADGRKDARDIAKALKGYGIERISTSPTPRTRQTAEIASKILDVPWRVDEGLVAWDLGILTGKLVDEAFDLVKKLERNPDMVVPDGETYRTWYERFAETLWKYIGWAKGGAPNTLLFSHARNLTAAPEILKDKQPKALDWAHAPAPGSILEICVGRVCTPKLILGKYADKTL